MSTEKTYKLYTDGGSRGNPGPAATGWLLFDPVNQLIDFGGEYLGEFTNNYAEYLALASAITKIYKQNKSLNIKTLSCYLDSELVVKQLSGIYKIKHPELAEIAKKIQKLLLEFETVNFVHVPRAENKFADKLVNICLDAAQASQL